MGWREAARLADVAFGEVALQATYALRQGNPVPSGGGRRFVAKARRRVGQSKALIAALLAILALGAAVLMRQASTHPAFLPPGPPPALYQSAVLTALAGVDVVLLWWNGIQALPTFVGSSVIAVLQPLPIDRATLRRTAVIVFARMFDLPAIVVLVGTPLFVGIALGPAAGLATVPVVGCAVAFALALSLVTGRFFVRRVQGSRGGGGSTILRWAYLLLWALPVFGLLGFVTAFPPFLRIVEAIGSGSAPLSAQGFVAVFPLALAIWPGVAANGLHALGPSPRVEWIAGIASIGYVALAAAAVAWMVRSVADVAVVPPTSLSPGASSSFALRTRRPALAVLTKDLRLASRTPAYAFVLLLPLLDAVALGLVTYAGAPHTSAASDVALGAVSAAALLATFFAPAFFALEVIAQSYGRTLPLSTRAMTIGKVTLVGAIYLASGGIVLAITALRVATPGLFALFVGAELPAVIAAGLLELGLLFHWSRRRGLPVTNLYTGAWNVVLVAIPGVLVAGAPLVAYVTHGLAVMAALAVGEAAVVAPIVLGRRAN